MLLVFQLTYYHIIWSHPPFSVCGLILRVHEAQLVWTNVVQPQTPQKADVPGAIRILSACHLFPAQLLFADAIIQQADTDKMTRSRNYRLAAMPRFFLYCSILSVEQLDFMLENAQTTF